MVTNSVNCCDNFSFIFPPTITKCVCLYVYVFFVHSVLWSHVTWASVALTLPRASAVAPVLRDTPAHRSRASASPTLPPTNRSVTVNTLTINYFTFLSVTSFIITILARVMARKQMGFLMFYLISHLSYDGNSREDHKTQSRSTFWTIVDNIATTLQVGLLFM